MKKCRRLGTTEKKWILAVCAFLLANSVTISVSAENYISEITPEMEKQGVISNRQTEDAVDRIAIGDYITYDKTENLYCYTVDKGEIYSNVIDNMITQDHVTVSTDDSVNIYVIRDGVQLEESKEYDLNDVGDYTVLTDSNGEDTKVFAFRILGDYAPVSKNYYLPTTCVATQVLKDGEDVLEDERVISFEEEGDYSVSYVCVRNDMEYHLECKADFTPPKLEFEGLKNWKSRNPVIIKTTEEDTRIVVRRDGKVVRTAMVLEYPGVYQVEASDPAGNIQTYNFKIGFYMNIHGSSFIIIILLLILGIAVYLYISKKRLRIR